MRFNRVLLIHPPFERLFGEGAAPRGVKTPLGLCHIAGYLEKNGIYTRVYNTDFIHNPKVLSSKLSVSFFAPRYLRMAPNCM